MPRRRYDHLGSGRVRSVAFFFRSGRACVTSGRLTRLEHRVCLWTRRLLFLLFAKTPTFRYANAVFRLFVSWFFSEKCPYDFLPSYHNERYAGQRNDDRTIHSGVDSDPYRLLSSQIRLNIAKLRQGRGNTDLASFETQMKRVFSLFQCILYKKNILIQVFKVSRTVITICMVASDF